MFKSGNSVALRLPKALGLEAGQEMSLREHDGKLELVKVDEKPRKIDLTGIYGSIPHLDPLAAADRVFEERELDWNGSRLGDAR